MGGGNSGNYGTQLHPWFSCPNIPFGVLITFHASREGDVQM